VPLSIFVKQFVADNEKHLPKKYELCKKIASIWK